MRIKNFVLLTLISASTQIFAQEPMDGYYSNDLLDAVHEAKQAPHHYDYSSTYRYKRTTAQSIELDRLDLGEMDDAMLKGALDAPSSDSTIDEPSNNEFANLDDQGLDSDSIQTRVDYTLPNQPIASGSTVSRTPNGIMSTQGIQNSSTLISTPRP